MKLARISAKLVAALAMLLLAVPLVRAQAEQAAPAQPAPAAKAKSSSAKAKPQGKSHAKAKPAPVAKPAPAAEKAEAAPEAKLETVAAKRDPFEPLINVKKEEKHYPPGKAGLVIATVRVDGTVRSPSGMIAVVTNPEQRVYFVREGDHLYDGEVEKIGLDGVTFREESKDAFGKPMERSVTKRIYGSAGDQQ
jgi:Tfp pilus assembly protein PilP